MFSAFVFTVAFDIPTLSSNNPNIGNHFDANEVRLSLRLFFLPRQEGLVATCMTNVYTNNRLQLRTLALLVALPVLMVAAPRRSPFKLPTARLSEATKRGSSKKVMID